MTKETETYFSKIPKVNYPRSTFNMSHSVKTTWNNGQVIPVMVDGDITPGDTVTMDIAEVVRMATPIYPVMDNMYMDIMAFFCPKRLLWEHWEEFWGENDSPWTQQIEYEEPQLTAPEGGWAEGSLADYFGIPTYVDGIKVSALQGRGYAKVWSDWFRDENLKSCAHYYEDDTDRTGKNVVSGFYDYVTDTELMAAPLPAAKLHDYFTSALPSPQRGPDVLLPLGNQAKVYTGEIHNPNNPNQPGLWGLNGELYDTSTGTAVDFETGKSYEMGLYKPNEEAQYQLEIGIHNNIPASNGYTYIPNNLYADLQNATAATISQIRLAFQLQRLFEARARFGTRYIETLLGIFGVVSSDARLQRSEYLGGVRLPINMDQVLQTSSTDATSPQANPAGFSCTVGKQSLFTKSFEEHGILYVMVVCRHDNTYQQGIPKQFLRRKNTDYYTPYLAHISEQPVWVKEIYATGTDSDDDVFGYQEAWADMRTKQNIVTAMMRSNSPSGSLDAWHYADDYSEQPMLSGEWIDESANNVDRTIAVTSGLAHQFIGDFYFKTRYTRCMPVRSIPGLVDHV